MPLVNAGRGLATKTVSSRVIAKAAPGKPAPRGAKPPARPPAKAGVNSPLYDPSQTLSGQPLADAAKQIANLQVQPTINNARSQIGRNNVATARESKVDFGYYMQLAQAAKDAYHDQQGAGSALQTQLGQVNTGTQNALAGINQSASSGALARMQALGLDAGGTAALSGDLAKQQSTGLLNGQIAATQGATDSAAATGATNQIRGATALRGTEQIGALGRAGVLANAPLNQTIANAQSQRGALTATALGQLRQQERNYQIAEQGIGATATQNAAKNQLAANAQLLTKRGQDITIASTKARLALQKRGIDVRAANDLANQLIAKAKLDEKRTNDTGNLLERQTNDSNIAAYRQAEYNLQNNPGKALPGATQARLWGDITHIEGLIRSGQAARAQSAAGTIKATLPNGKPNPNYIPPGANIRQLIERKYNFPDQFMEAAYELVGYNGTLTTQTAQMLSAMGLRGGTYNGQPIKTRNSIPKPAPNPLMAGVGGPSPLSATNNGL